MADPSPPLLREPWFLKFHDLMPFRVREILLVSSQYDAFILEEDGRLDERLFTQFSEMGLSASPRITHVASAKAAMEALQSRPFQLVMSVVRLEDTDAATFGLMVKGRYPELPLVLLTFDEADLRRFPRGAPPAAFDRAFLWTGDASILGAAIKLVEDASNAEHDTRLAGVQAIIVVEDSIRRYSTFLALLYAELMAQSQSLIAEGLNNLHRLMRMRGRPKILLAQTFEEAESVFQEYRDNVMAVISDVRLPRAGVEDPEAGFRLVEQIRKVRSELPIMIQSAEPELEKRAQELGAWHADKNAVTVLAQIRSFLKEALGFGEFVFRLPDRTETGRAKDLYELEKLLRTVPAASVEYHAARHHFSMWLNARAMFSLSHQLRRRHVSEFASIEELRQYLIDVLHQELASDQKAVMADFARAFRGEEQVLVRLGKGSIGGKGRGIAFVNVELARHGLPERLPGLDVRIPKTALLGTDEFDRFLEENGIRLDALRDLDDAAIRKTFLQGRLRPELEQELSEAWSHLQGPLAIRSSSLLEDSRFQPFAGIYATVMLPNNHEDAKVRLRELQQAIKVVYASTFSREAQSYFGSVPHFIGEEKMAVVIQEMVGRCYGKRFYPHISGVAQSYNYYPVGHQSSEDGVAQVALGLGHAVTSGGTSLRFCPKSPEMLPQFPNARQFVRYSQTRFLALEMEKPLCDFEAGAESSIVTCELADAEEDGTLQLVGSVYAAADDVIRDSLSLPGPRVVTFNNILKWGELPLARALDELLRIFRQGIGGDVEIEFAVDLKPSPSGPPCLYVLQVRPMATLGPQGDVGSLENVAPERVLCRTERALGHGTIDGIRDVVYVTRQSLDFGSARATASEVGAINRDLQAEQAPYLLIGPGRWGSADPCLGIPVDWSQIAGARVIVETCLSDRSVEPSQGTHFFQNITFLRIGYLTVDGVGKMRRADETFDRAWLEAQPAVRETASVRHVRLPRPLRVYLDGRRGRATILKPDDDPPDSGAASAAALERIRSGA